MVDWAFAAWTIGWMLAAGAAGYLMGRDHGRWSERTRQWRERDEAWDREHMPDKRA